MQVEVFGAGAGGGIWCRWRCDYAGDAGGRGWERVRSDRTGGRDGDDVTMIGRCVWVCRV